MTLSIMCVTKMEPFAVPFLNAMRALAKDCGAEFVVGVDSTESVRFEKDFADTALLVDAKGCLENVHDTVLAQCRGDYVLRLDDDEKCSPAMAQWVRLGSYKAHPHWKFPRAHLWKHGDKPMMLKTAQLWPDEQTRLSVRQMAGGRTSIHAGSPFGGGELTPVLIEHHKFLVRTLAERLDIVRRYDGIAEGAGRDFMAFNAPEIAYRGESVKLIPINDGRTDVGHYDQQCGGCGTWVTL